MVLIARRFKHLDFTKQGIFGMSSNLKKKMTFFPEANDGLMYRTNVTISTSRLGEFSWYEYSCLDCIYIVYPI